MVLEILFYILLLFSSKRDFPIISSVGCDHCPLYLHTHAHTHGVWCSYSLRSILRHRASLVAQMVKHLPAMQETPVGSLGWEGPLEKEMATHSSTLAWKIPWTEEPGRLQSKSSQRVRHDWMTALYTQLQIAFFFPLLSSFEWYCSCYSAVCWVSYPFSLNYLACC